MEDFSKRFNELPKLLGVKSMSQIARDTGFTPSSITSIARGETKPRFEVLYAIAIAYPQLNIRWLITGTNEPLLPEQNINEQDINDIVVEIRRDMENIKNRLSKLEED